MFTLNTNKKATANAVRAALLLGCAFSLPSLAAEEAKAAEETKQEESAKGADKAKENIITVTGIRGSLRDNLNNKRFSDNVVDSLNTEDIAKNPDKNMAEALQRIPGVQIERQFGEGAKISIRGTSPELTNTLVNGQAARSAEYLPGRSESNAFDFSNIPAEQVSKIEVFKTSQADIDAGGIGGTVILHTKKPLEQENGYGYVNLESEYNDSSEKNSPQLSAAYNFKTDDSKFGASINFSHSQRNAFRTGFESDGIASGTGFYQTDDIQCVTEACDVADFDLSNINNHAMIVTRHMALNDYTYDDLAAISSRAYWNNNAGDWGVGDVNIDPVYLDPTWGLFWSSRRNAGLGQTPGRTLGHFVYAPAFIKEEKRTDATINLQWAATDELNFNLQLNNNQTKRDNESHNLYSQPDRMVQYLYSNEVAEIDPRLQMDPVGDIVTSATLPIDGAWLVRGPGTIWDGNNYYTSSAKWGEMVRRDLNDRRGTKTEQSRVHLTADYETDEITLKVQAGRTTAESFYRDRGITFGSRRGAGDGYIGDDSNTPLPSYEGVNLFYNYNPVTQTVGWGVQGDPSVAGSQARAEAFLLSPNDQFYAMSLGTTEQTRENIEDFAQTDFTWEFENDFNITSVKFGAKYRSIERTNLAFTDSVRHHWAADQTQAFPLLYAGVVAGGTVSGLDSAGHNTPTEYFDINRDALSSLLENNFLTMYSEGTPNEDLCAAAIDDAYAAGDTNLYYGCRSGFTEAASQAYDVTEDIFAYYAMANFAGENFRGNVGVRVVDTEREYINNEVAKDENGQPMSYPVDESDPAYVAELAGFNVYQKLVTQSSTTDYLPSFNLSVDLADDLILRAAASKNISHPSLTQLRGSSYLVTERYRLTPDLPQDLTPEGLAERLPMDSQRRGSRGNPNLGSYTSVNSELGIEWYFDDASMFAVNAFQKDIKNIVRSGQQVVDLTDSFQGQTDSNGYPVFGEYVLSSFFNTGEQKVTGAELQFQHDFGNGFGGLVNYTYTDVPEQEFQVQSHAYEITDYTDIEYHQADAAQREYYEVTHFTTTTTTQSEPMLGQSKDTINASAYFENEDFSVRLSYNYRSEYAKGTYGSGIRMRDARQQFDLKATYNITDQLVANFSAINLTNENVVEYIDSSQIVNDPVFNRMVWETDENGDRVLATDADGNNIVESSITGEEAWNMLSDIVNVPVDELKPYYANHINKTIMNEWTNGRRFYVGLNYRF